MLRMSFIFKNFSAMPLIRHDGKLRGSWGLFLVPMNLLFGMTLSYRLRTGEVIHDLFYWVMISIMVVDLLLDLASTRKHRMAVEKDWKSVFGLYLRGWMVPDILAAIPFEYLADVFHWESEWTLLLRILPLSKTFKVSTVLEDLQTHLQMPGALMKLISLGYWGLQAIHAFSLGWWWVGGSPEEMETTPAKTGWVMEGGQLVQKTISEAEVRKFTNPEIYLRSVYWTVTTMTTIGYGDYSPSKDNNRQIIFTIIAQITGVSFYGFVVGNIPVLIANANAARAAFDSRNEVIGEFMRVKQLPVAMQDRVRDYYQYLWESRKGVSDSQVLGSLPHALSVDVLVFLNQEILQKVEFFKGVKEIFIREVVGMLTTETFIPGDYIIREGEFGTCMYFLTNGAVEVIVNGNTVAQLGTGSPFGEMALVSGDKRNASIRATAYCDMYVLERAGFDQLRSRYEDFDKNVVQITEQRAAANKKAQEAREIAARAAAEAKPEGNA
jgi:voltage-gated potassium channel